MGMFDHVDCRYPLPDNIPAGKVFQTKDLTNLMLDYTITPEGRLEEKGGTENWSGFTGKINIYWSNIAASGPGLYTRNGEDARVLEYSLTFVDGVVRTVEQLRNEYTPALEVSESSTWNTPPETEEERRQREAREQESLLGRTLWFWSGLSETGYAVKVVAESSKELVVQKENEQFEVLRRFNRDRLLFDSEEDGRRHKEEREAAWEAKRLEYEKALQLRQAAKEKRGNPEQP